MKSLYVGENFDFDAFEDYYIFDHETNSETDLGSDSTYNIVPELATTNFSIGASNKRSRNSKRTITTDKNNRNNNKMTITKKKKKKTKNSSRTWNFEDEITLLQGFINYSKSKQQQNNNNVASNDFFLFIRDSLLASIPNLTKRQLSDKFRRLKKKFNANRSSYPLHPPTHQHDQKVFELSNIIWGHDDHDHDRNHDDKNKQVTISGSERSDNDDDDDDDDDEVFLSDEYDIVILLPELLEDYLLDHGVRFDWLEEKDVKKLEENWKKVKVLEHKYVIEKSSLDIFMNRLKLQL
ncbi:hypothetical protein CsatA_014915 [Cannabis sativa]